MDIFRPSNLPHLSTVWVNVLIDACAAKIVRVVELLSGQAIAAAQGDKQQLELLTKMEDRVKALESARPVPAPRPASNGHHHGRRRAPPPPRQPAATTADPTTPAAITAGSP